MDVRLIPLPCGCVVDSDKVWFHETMECPWCRATFAFDDFERWVRADAYPIVVVTELPKPLVLFEGLVLELLYRIAPGIDAAREFGTRNMLRFALPSAELTALRN